MLRVDRPEQSQEGAAKMIINNCNDIIHRKRIFRLRLVHMERGDRSLVFILIAIPIGQGPWSRRWEREEQFD